MDKNSFVMYLDYEEQFNLLSNEELGILMRAIIQYEKTKIIPELDGTVKMAFSFIKTQLDKDRQKYILKCEKNKENGYKGGRPKKNDEKKPNGFLETEWFFQKPKKADNDNEDDNDNDDDIYNIATSEEKKSVVDAKASKHYGKYKHVLLKDEELHSLQRKYSNWEELIKYLDEYIEKKNYKVSSCYNTINKWVVNAVKQAPKNKFNTYEQRQGDINFTDLYANQS